MAEAQFGDWIKAVVDVSRGIMGVGGDLHAEEDGQDWIEFDSLINIRPGRGNRSRGVDDASARERIRALVESLVVAE